MRDQGVCTSPPLSIDLTTIVQDSGHPTNLILPIIREVPNARQ
jgi:hypothetical protein